MGLPLKSPTDENNSSNISGNKSSYGVGPNQPEDAAEKAEAAYEKYQEAKNYRKNWDKDWDRFFRYWAGQQNAGKMAWRTDATINLIKPIIESIVAHMTDSSPCINVQACEEDFIEQADVMQQVLYRTWIDNGMNTKLENCLRDMLVYGHSFMKCWYDKRSGIVTVDELDCRKIFPSAGATSVADAGYIVYSDNVPKSVVESKFPGAKGKMEGGLWDPELTFLKNITSTKKDGDIPGVSITPGQFPGVAPKTGGKSTTQDKDFVTYIEYWHRPNPEDWSEIWVTIAANGLLLAHKKNPFMHGKMPFVMFKDYSQTNTFWGYGEVSDLEKPQDSLNIRRGQIIDLLRLCANPPLLKSHNSGISNKTIPNVPGIMLTFNQGSEVRWMQTPQINEGLFRLNEIDKREMEEISGISDVSQGRQAKGVTAASGIALVQQIGQTRIRPKIRKMEETLTLLGELMLSGIQQFYTEEKVIRVAGKRKEFIRVNEPILDEETGEPALKNDLSMGKYDVNISVGSLPDWDKAQMYEQLKELIQLYPDLIPPKIVLNSVPGLRPEVVEDILMAQEEAKAQAAAPPEAGMVPGAEGAPVESILPPGFDERLAQLEGQP